MKTDTYQRQIDRHASNLKSLYAISKLDAHVRVFVADSTLLHFGNSMSPIKINYDLTDFTDADTRTKTKQEVVAQITSFLKENVPSYARELYVAKLKATIINNITAKAL